jgi:hypothetical protein
MAILFRIINNLTRPPEWTPSITITDNVIIRYHFYEISIRRKLIHRKKNDIVFSASVSIIAFLPYRGLGACAVQMVT